LRWGLALILTTVFCFFEVDDACRLTHAICCALNPLEIEVDSGVEIQVQVDVGHLRRWPSVLLLLLVERERDLTLRAWRRLVLFRPLLIRD